MPTYEVFINDKPRKIELAKIGEKAFTAKVDDKPVRAELADDKLDLEKVFLIKIGDKKYQVELPRITFEGLFQVKVEEATFKAEVRSQARTQSLMAFEPVSSSASTKRTTISRQVAEGAVTAPITGKILSVKAKKGDQVKAGQVLCIIEAMKMENEIAAPKAGTVREVYVSDGSSVSEGEVLMIVD